MTLAQAVPRTSGFLSVVLINDQQLAAKITSLQVRRFENEHDEATIGVMSGTRGADFDLLPGKRVEFDFGWRSNTLKFQGYVMSVNPQQRWVGTTNVVEQEIYCLGTSMIFKSNRPRFFTETTCTDAIARIVAERQLGFHDEFHNDDYVWRTLAQTSETDWEMINNLAYRIGAHVVTSMGVVRLIDYNDICARQLPSRYFTRSTRSMPKGRDEPALPAGGVIDFSPVNISNADPNYRVPSMAYLSGAKPVVVQGHSTFGIVTRFASALPANSAQEAAALQNGYYLPDWAQVSTLRVNGDATIEPAMVVQVSSGGRSFATVQNAFDGIWYVQGVEHYIEGTSFQTTLTLGRTGARTSNWSQERNFWMGDKRGIPRLICPDQLTWISTWR